MNAVRIALEYAWLPANTWYLGGFVLEMTGRISKRRLFCGRFFADLAMIAHFIAHTVTNGVDLLTWLTGLFAIFAYVDWRLWRKSRKDDDDDWGKRLKSWGKSHLPRPRIVQLRPGMGAA